MAEKDANIFYEPLYRELKKDYEHLQGENLRLRDQVAALTARVKELEEIVSRLTDTKTRYRFSLFGRGSKSGSSDRKQNRRKRSKDSYRRQRPTEKEITGRKELKLETCPSCSTPVSENTNTYETYVEDIVFMTKQVTQYTVHRHWCTHCKKQVHASIPDCLPGMRLGMNTVLYVLTEHYRYRATDDAIQESLMRYFRMSVSEGEVTNIRDTAANYFGEKYQEIIETIQHAKTVYADETGWLVNGEHWQCWHLGAPKEKAVRYIMADTRGKGIIEDALGEDFDGTVVADFYAAYQYLKGDSGKCWAHLLRETHSLVASQPKKRSRKELHALLKAVFIRITAFRERGWTRRGAKIMETKLRKELIRISQKQWTDRECRRIAARIDTYLDALLTCVRKKDVEPTNNIAERGLRPVVVHRNITHGNRSKKGAESYEKNKSVIETLVLEGGNLVENMKTLLWETAWKQKMAPP